MVSKNGGSTTAVIAVLEGLRQILLVVYSKLTLEILGFNGNELTL